ncbi:MAG: hypothetical protein RR262_18365, partial [Clostridium sp.]
MDLKQIFNALKNNKGETILESLGYDILTFMIRLLAFLIVLYLGKYLVKKVDEYIGKITVMNEDLNTKQFTRSITKLGLNLIVFLIGLLIFGFSEGSSATMISAIGLGVGISLK